MPVAEPPVRFGSTPEFFAAEVLPRLVGLDMAVSVTFGADAELFAQLDRGELDVIVTSSDPSSAQHRGRDARTPTSSSW